MISTTSVKFISANEADQPIRVAHLIVGLARAGAETALLRLILDTRGLVKHHVVVMTNERTLVGAMEDAGARVTVLGSSRTIPNPLLYRRATQALLSERPDIIHAWMWHAAALWSLCRIDFRIRRIPSVWGIRSSLDSFKRRFSNHIGIIIARLSSKYPSAIMFNSECSRLQHQRAAFCMEHASVTHNGVDIPDESSIEQWRRTIRAQIGVTDDAIVFMHVGRAHTDKGVGNFVKAAEIVHAQLGTRAVFVRVGKPGWETGQSGNDSALERSPWIYHAGEQVDARPWLAAADVCVVSSLRESCPNVVLEAMSVGTPVVTTDVGDAALLVGDDGWVVRPNSPLAIADAMSTAAATIVQSNHRARLWAACRTAVSERHSRKKVADGQVAVYREVIRRSSDAARLSEHH